MTQEPEVLAIILGGGRGARMSVLTRKRAKPAVGFGGKYRIIDWVMSNCARSNISDIWVMTQFRHGSLDRHLANGHSWGYDERYLRLLSPEEQEGEQLRRYRGTADAVRSCLSQIEELAPDLVLILAGDHIYSADYRRAVTTHVESSADITIYLHPVDRQWVKGMGLVQVDQSGRIQRFVEKPTDPDLIEELALAPEALKGLPRSENVSPEYGAFLGQKGGRTHTTQEGPQVEPSHLASMGIYLCSPEVLRAILAGPENDFGSQILPGLVEERRLQSLVYWGYWRDVGALEAFYWAHRELLRSVDYNIFNPYLVTNARELPSPLCLGEAHQSVISGGCYLHPGSVVRDSVLGYKVVVEAGAVVEDSILLGADRHTLTRLGRLRESHFTRIGPGARLRRVIIDKNLQIAPKVSLGVAELDLGERRRRLESLGLRYKKDFTLTETGLLVMAKPDRGRESPFPEGFEA